MDAHDLRKEAANEGIDLDEGTIRLTRAFQLSSKIEKRETRKSRRAWMYLIGAALATATGGSGFTAYKASETPAAVERADQKSDDLRAAEAQVAELKGQKADAKAAEVDERIGDLEDDVENIDGKMDTLIRMQLAPRDSEVRKAAEAAVKH
jgi:hypothetical protein